MALVKQRSSPYKQQAGQRPTAGPGGIALAPPAYGIDFSDGAAALGGETVLQRMEEDDEEPVQAKGLFQREAVPAARPQNRTGLPDALKNGVEALSGFSLDDVQVHTDSPKPAGLNALAYTQGTDIHVAPGQERHLPHEAWHVVQQKQGRVQPTMQMKGDVPVNDDVGLEREADAMGARALQIKLSPSHDASCIGAFTRHTEMDQIPYLSNDKPVVQRLKKHAQKYIKENDLGIEADYESVSKFINNTDKDKAQRMGLWREWMKGQKGVYKIALPDDLIPKGVSLTTTDDLEGWNSEDEDKLDLDKIIKSKKTEDMELERSDDSTVSGVPHFDFFDAIKLGRQIVKRDEYHRLPFTTSVGEHKMEFNSPGTKDIYVTPLEKTTGKELRYKRAGGSRDFNYKNLVKRLMLRYKLKLQQQAAMRQMMKFFLKKDKVDMTSEMAETIGAIGADFMKGSFGARYYLKKALRKLGSDKSAGIKKVFLGEKSMYAPARIGGRGLVVKMTMYERQVNYLLGFNNCLINAIAQAALGRNATLGELLRIRIRLGSVGNMLAASPNSINVIRQALGINNDVTVRYRLGNGTPNEVFARAGGNIDIFHTGEAHFTHVCPDPSQYDLS